MSIDTRMGNFILRMTVVAMASGMSYQEAAAGFETAALLMREIERNPNASKDELEQLAKKFVEERLSGKAAS